MTKKGRKDGKGKADEISAADAARLAATRGKTGIYNIAEDDGTVTITRAAEELGWRPGFRMTNDE